MMHTMTFNPITLRKENTYLRDKSERLLTITSGLLRRIEDQEETISQLQKDIRLMTVAIATESK